MTNIRHFLFVFALLCAQCGMLRAQTPYRPMEDMNKVTDLTLDSLEKAATARPLAGSTRKGGNPVLFLVGNSTMRTGTLGNGDNGQWGWGFYMHQHFDTDRISVENHALGGTSSRTFYRRLWNDVKHGIRPGDYVVIELGHNDNGPFDSGRARASIRGISGTDSLEVTIKETGEHEIVYSYGEYMRRFVSETRALGATPILMSLTPRNSRDEAGRIERVDRTFGLWARQIAEELDCPFVDLNEISAAKYDSMTPWKVGYHFYRDRIHTSAFGARLNAESAAEGIRTCTHPEIQPLAQMLLPENRPTTGVKRIPGRPVVFITGDSTVKNADSDKDGMWGWGALAAEVFDTTRITVQNSAMAGRSCRSFIREGRWDKVVNDLQPGDYVLIQFGHNDTGREIDHGKARNEISGAADSSRVFRVRTKDEVRNEVVYTFGWYLRKMIDDVRQQGATPIIVSLTPRNEWPDGKIERRNDSYGEWYRTVAEETGAPFLDLHNLSADSLDRIGQKKAAKYFKNDHTHTSRRGALLNAKNIAKGLKQLESPLAEYLK